MFPIDNSTAATSLPTPAAAGTPGYFTDGSPGAGTPATVVPADWFNGVQQELINVIDGAGLTPDKTVQNQVLAAIKLLSAGRFLGATVMTTSGTFTPNPLATKTRVRGAGGGGSGGNSSNTGAGQVSLAGGGMCGACGEALFVGALSGPVTVTIGAGGAPSVALGVAGTAGASTTFGSLLTLPGGNPGAGGAAVTAPATVEASGASVLLPTTTGTFLWSTGTSNTNSRSVAISSAVYWGANGTACPFGFGNSGHGSGGPGNAVGPSASGVAGLAGNPGLIIVEEYA